MILALHAVEIALLVYVLVLLHRPTVASTVTRLATTALPTVAPPATTARVLLLCGPEGDVQHEVSTSALEGAFPRDYEYGGTIYRLVVADETTATYRAFTGPQARRAVTRGR